MTIRRFTVADRRDVDQLMAALERRPDFVREPAAKLRRVYFDTFDWRLLRSNCSLEKIDGTEVVWRSRVTGETLARFDLDTVPRFACDFPTGPAAARLADTLEMRALLPLVEIRTNRTALRVLDAEAKTVGRIIIDDPTAYAVSDPKAGPKRSNVNRGQRLPTVVEVIPVRGYAREARTLADLLTAQIILTPIEDDVLVTALRAVGFQPGSYSSKLNVQLNAAGSAREAWVTVLEELLGAIRTNDAGLRDDLDSEFLHDYRVAVRRTRSILGQADGVFPAVALRHFRDEFAWLGQATSPTRDLDVFLLDLPAFRDGLPAERRADLKPFRAFLENHQHEAHRSLVAQLKTRRYHNLIARWRTFLDEQAVGEPESEATEAATPAPDIASKRIAAAHRRVIKDGRKITATSEPERLHDLRKDAKRLRYLLECFGGLFPAEEVQPEIKKLKGLQDVLGEYQDCQHQIGSLERFAQALLDDGAPAPAVMAMGLLVEQFDHRERVARDQFDERFAAFDHRRAKTGKHQKSSKPSKHPKKEHYE